MDFGGVYDRLQAIALLQACRDDARSGFGLHP